MSKRLNSIEGFIPYIAVLFINAFTDLGHKIIIQNSVFKLYDERLQIILTAFLSALVLLPFIMLFSPSGFLSDKYPKHTIMKYSSLAAVVITLGITLSYYLGLFYLAFFFTFLLSTQSAIFSPAKYGYIKELVGESRITMGNAVVQAVTTVAILGGILFYTVLFENALTDEFATASDILQQIAPIGWLLVISSLFEYYLTLRLPNRQIAPSKKRFNFKKYKNGYYLRKNLRVIMRKRKIVIAIVALSLFWSISQVVLAIFGAYAKTQLHVDNAIMVQGMMALAGIGIIVGSFLSAKISKYFIHLGAAPLGALGFSIITLMLPFLTSLTAIATAFFTFGIFAGLFIVPLNAYIQQRSPRVHLGTILAGNNFIQNIFMFTALLLTTLFAYYGLNSFSLFLIMGSIGLVLCVYLIRSYLVMLIWLVLELLLSLRYKIRYVGVENVSDESAVLLLGNHISWIDWLLVQLPLRRRINYVMDRDIYEAKFLKPFFKLGNAIPISARGAKEAFKRASECIASREMVALFPEGRISYDGEIGKFYRGFEQVAKNYNGTIVPFYIGNMYGSLFSRSKTKNILKHLLFRREITITFAQGISLQSSSQEVRDAVLRLKKETL
ncbi:MAG: MFS transporter [Campylobacterota bacterium]|nr:MFS transporter [Campylobacterota bacterium]